MTKWDKVSYDMIDGSGSSNATFLRVLYLPKKAKVAKLVVATKTTFAGNSTAITFKLNYPAGVDQTTGAAAAAADIVAAFDLDAEATGAVAEKAGGMVMPPLNNSTADISNSNVSSYATNSDNDVVPVVGTIVVATGVPTSGEMHWWVEYAFDANIVWTQADLA